jgi:proline iminopeptidase
MRLRIIIITFLIIFNFSYSQNYPKIEDGFLKSKDGLKLYYQKFGTGSDVVIIPSGMYLAGEFKRFANHSRSIIFYDQRGRGRSDKVRDKEKLNVQNELSDIESIRKHFKLDKVSFIGWSYSGGVVALYTIKYPQHVRRVIQICSIPPRKKHYWDQYIKINTQRLNDNDRRKIVEIHSRYKENSNTGGYIKEYYRIAHKAIFYGDIIENKFREDFYTLTNERPDNVWKFVIPNIINSLGNWDFRVELSKLEIPFLTIHGCHDAIPLSSAKEWIEYLPQGRLLLIYEAGHMPWLEKPQVVYDAIGVFLSGKWPEN